MSLQAEVPQTETGPEQAKQELAALMTEIDDLENFRGSETDAPLEETLADLKPEESLSDSAATPLDEAAVETMAQDVLSMSASIEDSKVVQLHPGSLTDTDADPLPVFDAAEEPSTEQFASAGNLNLNLQGVETFSIQARVGGREISVTLDRDSIAVKTGDGTEVRLPLRQMSKAG